ncbi:MAG: phospholipid carrier-dependent glycosyltransferase [Cyanobacteria bacterium RI_101]|nr:phospholipid carrier-dependent glycosyltransferase [Cyanobacteria bacterium RI_101]
MPLKKFSLSLDGFNVAVLLVFLVSLSLRFWGLERFNALVFDEVYYAKFANDYWLGKPFFPSHPPLSHYLIALGLGIGSLLPADPDSVNTLTGSLHSTWSYRWLNALVGSFIPLLVGAVAYLLTRRRMLTLLVMVLALLDGLYLVESRYALNNIYLIFFGLLGQIGVLSYLRRPRFRFLMLGGVFLGCAGAVKWNGFAFLLGIYLLWALAWLWRGEKNPLQRWRALKPLPVLLTLVFLPALTYSLLWIPHLLLNPDYRSLAGFGRIHWETWQYHNRIGNDPSVHPYCSPWHSWLILWRPVAYYYQTVGAHKIVYDVHSMANPILLWFSTGALFLWFGALLFARNGAYPREISLYLGINYLVNLLPWLKISRCAFFYHYMSAYLFSWFALALVLETLWRQRTSFSRAVFCLTLGIIALGFLYWLPIFLGLPLTPRAFGARMWLRSWI